MAYTNNEKQQRHLKLEKLKKIGNDILIRWTISDMSYRSNIKKSNAEIQTEIEQIVNLPAGWTDQEYENACKKLENLYIQTNENPHLMNNDISSSFNVNTSSDIDLMKKAKYIAPEVVRNILSTLKISNLSKSIQIAITSEVLRQLAKELINENNVPKTFANATAFSLIDQNYDKPEWLANILARNLYTQNGPEFINLLISELQKKEIKDGGLIINE